MPWLLRALVFGNASCIADRNGWTIFIGLFVHCRDLAGMRVVQSVMEMDGMKQDLSWISIQLHPPNYPFASTYFLIGYPPNGSWISALQIYFPCILHDIFMFLMTSVVTVSLNG